MPLNDDGASGLPVIQGDMVGAIWRCRLRLLTKPTVLGPGRLLRAIRFTSVSHPEPGGKLVCSFPFLLNLPRANFRFGWLGECSGIWAQRDRRWRQQTLGPGKGRAGSRTVRLLLIPRYARNEREPRGAG